MNDEPAIRKDQPFSLASYISGFVLSVGLTLTAYLAVSRHAYIGWHLFYAVLLLAIIQLVVQMVFFLHIGKGPNKRWNIVSLALMVIIVLIVVVGSVWIMHNLNYRMTPQEMDKYMRAQDGGI